MTALPAEPTDDTLTAAHRYADAGLRVLPIRPGEKRPPMAAWQDAATTDHDMIDAWWTQLYRGHGIGIATGPESGIFVLDVDITGNKAGDETLADLTDTYGPLPDTATVITASGGTHHYFRLPAGVDIRNSAATRLGPGLDIRGRGGQVVAPPTRLGDSAYEWDGGEMSEIADPPAWLIGLLTAEPERPTPPPATPANDDDSIAARYNHGTTWDELLTADGWTLAHVTPDGEQRWTRPGKDAKQGSSATVGHDGRDVLKVFTDGVPGLEQERAYSRFGYTAAVHHHGDRSAFARHLAQQERDATWIGDVPAWMPTGALEVPTVDRVELAHLVDWGRFWDQDHSDEEWLAYPIIPKGRAIALYAPAKAGKSTVVLAIAAALATGRPILGNRRHNPARVLYLDYEMTEADLYERLSELGYGPGDDLHRLSYALLPSLPPLDTVEGATAILGLVDRTDAELVVVDTFGRAVGGEEDSADTVRAFYRHTGLSLKARGVTYLRTDHSGKDVGKGQRGSSAKNDDVDLVWRLTRTETKDGREVNHGVRLERTHSRVSWVPEEIKINRVPTDSGFDFIMDTNTHTYPDGTRQAMEAMVAAGVEVGDSHRVAQKKLKAAGVVIKQVMFRAALTMMRDSADRRDVLEATIQAFQPAQKRVNALDPEARCPNGNAQGSDSNALNAPKGNKGTDSNAPDPTGNASASRSVRLSKETHNAAPHPDDPDFLPEGTYI